MKITFYLRPAAGAAPAEAPLYIMASTGRSYRERRKTEINVPPALWDDDTHALRTRTSWQRNRAAGIQKEIDALEAYVKQRFNEKKPPIPRKGDLCAFLDDYYASLQAPLRPGKGGEGTTPFYDLFEPYAQENRLSDLRIRSYRSLANSLRRYEHWKQITHRRFTLTVEMVDEDAIRDIRDFLYAEYRILGQHPEISEGVPYSKTPKPRCTNTVSDLEKKLRAVLNWSEKKGYIGQNPFRRVSITKATYGNIIFLTKEEVERLWLCDFSHSQKMDRIRDVFIFSTQCGLRYGDIMRLTEGNIANDCINITPSKTNKLSSEVLSIPLTEKARQIIEKHAKAPRNYHNRGKLLAVINQQQYNASLKAMAEYAGLDRIVTVYSPQLGREVQRPLYECITSHTGRKTFINTLFNAGVPSEVISSMSGHLPNSAAFSRYRKISDDLKRNNIRMLDDGTTRTTGADALLHELGLADSAQKNEKTRKILAEIKKRSGGKCEACGSRLEAGNPLVIHHEYYIAGARPWEYPTDALRCLCAKCHYELHARLTEKFQKPPVQTADGQPAEMPPQQECPACRGIGITRWTRSINGMCFRCLGTGVLHPRFTGEECRAYGKEIYREWKAKTGDGRFSGAGGVADWLRTMNTEEDIRNAFREKPTLD